MRKLIAQIIALAFVLAACNIGVKAPLPANVNEAVATIVAQTLQAATELAVKGSTAEPPTPVASPLPPTTSAPVLTINDPTNCRSGPGTNFQLIMAFTPGTKLLLLGKDTADNYWLVQIPQTQNTCWVPGEYATAGGNFAGLPEVTPTAGTVSNAPARPSSLFYNYACASLTEATITLTWKDTANNESGYRVYSNGTLIADLPANSTTFTDNVSRGPGSVFSYSIEAYNNTGASSSRTGNFKLSGCANP
jgi:hypothetical protein